MIIYGILGIDNGVVDVSNTLHGAKCYATRHGYNEIYSRSVNIGYVQRKLVKLDGKWYDVKNLEGLHLDLFRSPKDPRYLCRHDHLKDDAIFYSIYFCGEYVATFEGDVEDMLLEMDNLMVERE